MVGREMEAFYGTRDFVALYLSAAVVSTLCWALADTFEPARRPRADVGASGAVMAVVVLYTLYYPRREVSLFIFPVEMWLLLVVYLGLRPAPASSARARRPVGLRGAPRRGGVRLPVQGGRPPALPAEKLFRREAPAPDRLGRAPRAVAPAARPSVGPPGRPTPPPPPGPSPTAVIPEEQFDAKLDEILVKIAREGRGALTEDENRILEEASRRARNRRSERI